jgi:hypothetical protein
MDGSPGRIAIGLRASVMSAGYAGLDTNLRCFAASTGSNLSQLQEKKAPQGDPLLNLYRGQDLPTANLA